MSSMYGHKWVSSYGADVDPDGIWQAVITGLTAKQVQMGVEMCRLNGLEWPPSAPQFRALCLGKDIRSIDDQGNDAHWQQGQIRAADKASPVRYYRNEQGELIEQFPLPDLGKRQRSERARDAHIDKLKSMFS